MVQYSLQMKFGELKAVPIKVDRSKVLSSAMDAFGKMKRAELRSKIKVTFVGEEKTIDVSASPNCL